MTMLGAFLGVIPCRMASSRFPGKPLAPILGRPMIWHVFRRAKLARGLDQVVVATCDQAIAEVARQFGATVVMTSASHVRSNDRVAEVAEKLRPEVVVNIQGDEPLVHPNLIEDVCSMLRSRPEVQCVNPVAEILVEREQNSPNTIKTVYSLSGRVLYFSRLPIPSDRANRRAIPCMRQVPILGFRADFAIALSKLPMGPNELQEGTDTMRAIEHDLPVHVLATKHQTVGVDVPEDVPIVEELLKRDVIYTLYKDLP